MADETTKMHLVHDLTTNGVTYKAGTNVEVPKAQVDDLARRDHEYSEYERNLMIKRTFESNAGTMSMGGGAH